MPEFREPIQLIQCLRRRAGVDVETFADRVATAYPHHQLGIAGLRRAVQYDALPPDLLDRRRPEEDPRTRGRYDVIAVSWWDNLAALKAGLDAAAGLDAFEVSGAATAESTAFVAREVAVCPPAQNYSVVMMSCLRRLSGLSRGAFSAHWRSHGRLGKAAHARGLMQGYVQSHALSPGEPGTEELCGLPPVATWWDGMVTASFADVVTANRLFADAEIRDAAMADERRFIDHARGAAILMTPRLIGDHSAGRTNPR